MQLRKNPQNPSPEFRKVCERELLLMLEATQACTKGWEEKGRSRSWAACREEELGGREERSG